jgi:cyclopropane fatty-acyl-phospholipid synthase-like methyltransferase
MLAAVALQSAASTAWITASVAPRRASAAQTPASQWLIERQNPPGNYREPQDAEPRRGIAEPVINKSTFTRSFPLTAKYDAQWILDNALGENALCQAECLARHLSFEPGMRVLDLGCGKATGSIFLAREFGVEVWALDAATCPTDNQVRVVGFGCEGKVFPLRIDARALPFPKSFFDAVIAVDSFLYFGTDDHYLPYLAEFIKPGGAIGVVDMAFTREIESLEDAPDFLPTQSQHWGHVHTVEWWKRHWAKTGLVDLEWAEILPESKELLRMYVDERPLMREADSIMRAVPLDRHGLIALFCLVARKR